MIAYIPSTGVNKMKESVQTTAENLFPKLAKKAITSYKWKLRCDTDTDYTVILTAMLSNKSINRLLSFLGIKKMVDNEIDKKYYSFLEKYISKEMNAIQEHLDRQPKKIRLLNYHIIRAAFLPAISDLSEHVVILEIGGVYVDL